MSGESRVAAAAVGADPLAIRFANTCYGSRTTIQEGLATPRLLTDWLRANAASLAQAGVPGESWASVRGVDLARFVALRDTIRSLIRAAVDGEPLDPTRIAALNEAAALAPAWPVLVSGPSGITLARRCIPTRDLAALGAIARDAVELLGGQTSADLRACQAPGCVQFFISHQARRAWCSAACGNRARVARHYRRHKPA